MGMTIDQLEVEVQSNAQSATSGVDALAASLEKLKTVTKGGLGLTSIATQMTKLNTALSSVSRANAGKLSDFAYALKNLQGVGNVKISSSIGNQITSIGNAIKSLDNVDMAKTTQLANALAPLTTLGKTNIGSFAKNIDKFTTSLKNMDLPTIESQVKTLTSALAPLAVQMRAISDGFKAFPARIQNLIKANTKLNTSNKKVANSYTNLAAKMAIAVTMVRRAASVISSMIKSANKYIEDMNLFTVSMGKYAEEAAKYAETVSEIMGIDPAEFMRNEGIFNTIIKGFGVVEDRAYTMSKNLTQLGYDIASFYNISFEDAFTKLQSGIAGELEPLRRLGYDLSVARLQEEALALGIEEKVSAMTQAEKAELRYYAIMTQVTAAQGDMARTLTAPANQLRVLKAEVTQCARAWGNLFIPILNAVLPYVMAVAKALRMLADMIASFFGIELPTVDWGKDMGGISSSTGDIADDLSDASDSLGEATKKAKKMKDYLLGIDELNVLSKPDEDDGSGKKKGGAGVGGGIGGLGFELPEYDFLGDAVAGKVDEILENLKNKIKELLPWIAAVGAGFLAWKIAKGLVTGLEKLKGLLKGFNGGVLNFGTVGLLGFLSDMNEFRKFFEDFQENGATFWNVGGMISEFVGMIGDALLMLGSLKLGGALKIIQGVGEIVVACKDIADNGVNWENARLAIRGVTNIAIGIGALMGNTQGLALAGVALTVQGMLNVIDEVKNIIEAVKTGDWSGVDWVNLAIGALEVIGGLVVAISAFKKIKGAADIANAGSDVAEVAAQTTAMTTATDSLNEAVGSGGLTGKLTTLVKDLALGIVIIAEVAAAALLFVGAIILLGMELEQVGIAWTPVLAQGSTVLIALGLGTALLVAVGVATALLGSVGTPLIVNIALGTAILAELGVAAGLFILEIWAIGKGLDEIWQAWQPVLDNGETIAEGIGLGTALLIGIGVVTAALGVATVASAGLLPLAIGLGTALLVELAAATVLFIESLTSVATELNDNLAPALEDLNGKLPDLTTNMSNFVDFMTSFADEVVRYTTVSSIAGIAATIDTIIGWFTEDPIEKLAGDVDNVATQTASLNTSLNVAVPELESCVGLLESYQTFLSQIENLTTTNPDLSQGTFANMEEVGQKIVTGFVSGIESKSSDFKNAATTLVDGFKTSLDTASSNTQSSVTTWGTNLKNWFTSTSYGGVNKVTWQQYAKDIITGFTTGITSNYGTSKSGIVSWANNIKNWFTLSSYGGVNKTKWQQFAKDIVQGFSTGITNNYSTSRSSIQSWGRNTVTWFEKPWNNDTTIASKFKEIGKFVVQGFINGIDENLDSARKKVQELAQLAQQAAEAKLKIGSPSKVFAEIGSFVVQGFNIGLTSEMSNTALVMSKWLADINSFNPQVAFAVDTSALSFSDQKSLQASVVTQAHVVMDDNSQGMEEAFRTVMREFNMSQMVEDVRRQADKQEQTVVQIGNKVVTDAVVTQQRANGYRFVTQ